MFSQITQWVKLACCSLLIGLLSIGLVSCGGDEEKPQAEETEAVSKPQATLTEVAPPAIFEELRQTLDNYQPQVSIISPKNGDVIDDTRVDIEVDVKDYPLFKNEELGLGPHLHVILDNQPYRAVYTAEKPIVFEDLDPGTHTIRMFASRPWDESFKNEGAYAQVTFHLFTETGDNAPDAEQPLLTYSRPKGTYGAEPILLDYYLTNAPIRLGEEDDTAINPASQRDWRVRATINGERFILDNWLPVYLEGFEVGQNWIKLELLDGDGNLIDNAFNTAARLFTYQPEGEDTLSQLVRGELTAAEARGIVDADYQVPVEEPEEKETVTEEETPAEAVEPETPPEESTPEETVTEEETPADVEEESAAEPETVTEEETPAEAVEPETPLEESTPEETVTEEETPAEVEEESSAEPEAVTEEETPADVVEPETPLEEFTPEETVTEEETPADVKEESAAEPEAVTEEETAEQSSPEMPEEKIEDQETAVEEQKTIAQ